MDSGDSVQFAIIFSYFVNCFSALNEKVYHSGVEEWVSFFSLDCKSKRKCLMVLLQLLCIVRTCLTITLVLVHLVTGWLSQFQPSPQCFSIQCKEIQQMQATSVPYKLKAVFHGLPADLFYLAGQSYATKPKWAAKDFGGV